MGEARLAATARRRATSMSSQVVAAGSSAAASRHGVPAGALRSRTWASRMRRVYGVPTSGGVSSAAATRNAQIGYPT